MKVYVKAMGLAFLTGSLVSVILPAALVSHERVP